LFARRKAEPFTGKKGIYTRREDTLKSFDAICNGEADGLPEQAFPVHR
jgi:F-type H+/Na+-transporting ATPase subunit beta